MRKLSIVLLFLFFIIVSCSKDNPTSTNSNAGGKFIWSLKIGNFWNYLITNYDSLGNVIRTNMDSIVIVKDSTINSEQVFYMATYRDKKLYFAGFVQNRNDGYYVIDLSGGFPSFFHFYKFKGSAGDKYMNGNQEMVINSINSSVSLISKNFICYEYFQESKFMDKYTKQNVYLAPDNGLIKSVSYEQMKGGKLYMKDKQEITGYSLK